MRVSKDVIVIGAGIIGASIAWHLAHAGARVTVIAGSDAGGVATPNSFAWVNAGWGNPEAYFRLRIRAMAEWKRLASQVPDIPLVWTGGLCWDLPPAGINAYAIEHSSWGYGIRRVGGAEAARIEPNLVKLPDVALHVAQEGAVEPVLATRAMLSDAERQGARILTGATVTALGETKGRRVAVETARGRVEADEIVLAAGAGSAPLAAMVGVSLPIEAPSGLLVHSRPHGRLLAGLVFAEKLHMRQTAEGRIVAGSSFGGADPGSDPAETARNLFAEVKAMLRGADRLQPDFHTVGYRPTPTDGFPIIGRAGGSKGIYVAVMHSGITLAPAVGLFVADEILNDRRDPLLAPYGLSRFGGG